jgi:rfaE bifunctional protein nucleotidyltransferase chain/domain/rfaE bifunctional protein kinase chain/domain
VSIVVVGDTLLDVDVAGTADRLSPDAPVPVVDVQTTTERPGGAGLVARLLARDGQAVRLVTVLGDDDAATRLRTIVAEAGVDLVAGPSGAATPVKTRLQAAGQALVRMDTGTEAPPPARATPEMLAAIAAADVLVVADYGRGLADAPEIRAALERRGREVPLVWDPHPRGPAPVRSATLVTPNLREALRASGVPAGTSTVAAATDAATELLERWGSAAVAVTLGSAGALLLERGSSAPLVVPAPASEVTDPCGGGDRLVASLAVELLRGSSVVDALGIAVADASAFLAAGGVASLVGEPAPAPLRGMATDAFRVVQRVRAGGGTVVATGGCFDLVHAGHAKTLSAARALGDCLVVCLNSDSSVRALKGPQRPIMSQADRSDLLLALECVDAVLVFDEQTPEQALRQLEPDLWVKGGDYSADELPESELVRSWGGRTVIVPFVPGRSTTTLASALARVG